MREFVRHYKIQKLFAWLLIAAMLLECGLESTIVALADTVSVRTHIESTDLTLSQTWTLDCENTKIICEMTDKRTDRNLGIMMTLMKEDETDYSNFLSKVSGRLVSNVGSITLDLTSVAAGNYKLLLWEQLSGSSGYYVIGVYKIQITAEGLSFLDSAYSTQEETFIGNIGSTVEPSRYASIPYTYYDSVNNLSEIADKAAVLTEGCSTQTEMVEEIYNWIGNTITYDSEAIANNSTANPSNPEWVFDNQRAVCTGYAKLFQIMVTSLGIPCILVSGDASSVDIVSSPSSHMWNLVYLNDSWCIVDVTWSTPNEYFGEDNLSNISGNLAYQNYLGISPMEFGETHHSKESYCIPGAKSIEFVKQPTNTEFYYGDTFVFDGSLQLVSSDDSKYAISNDKIKITGYDMQKEGNQTINVSYGNLYTSYQIRVNPPKADEVTIKKIEFSTEPVTTVFEKGDEFIFDGNVQYVDENDVAHLIDSDDERLIISGYDMNTVGNQVVTVSYDKFTVTYDIVVNEPNLSGVYIAGDDISVNQQAAFTVPVTLRNNTGIMGLGIDVKYDSDIFEQPKVTKGVILGSGTFNDSVTEETNGSFKILWSGTENMTSDGELIQLSFHVKSNVKAGKYAIKFINRKGDTFDEAYNDVAIKGVPVIITVKDKTAAEEEAEKLQNKIEAAKTSLDSYVDLSKYDETQKNKVLQIINQAKEDIKNAKNEAAVDAIVSQAHANIDALPKTSTPTTAETPEQSEETTQDDTKKPQTPITTKKYPKAKGTVIKYSSGNAYYKVTKSSNYGTSTVEYVKPINKKKTYVKIPYSISFDGVTYYVTSIAPKAFKNNKKVKKIYLSDVEKIGKSAFQGCTALKTVEGSDVQYIEDYAFSGCKNLKTISLFYVKNIEKKAFYNCMNLESIFLYNVRKIGENAFYNCKSLYDINILSKKLSSVGNKAFYNICDEAEIWLYKKSYVKKIKKVVQKKTKIYLNYEPI